jgi:polysaccharide deacetylase family protein (PEP-CTERM system associated)
VARRIHVLTFDIEDWFHLLQHEETATESRWCQYETRVARNTDLILDCLAEAGVRATFFCLGWIARTHPEVIRSIHAAGHGIGSHSNSHQLVHQLTPQQFSDDLVDSIDRLQDITGAKVRAYRSPGFSITSESAWAFAILAENGIEIDSSVFVSRRAHGGFPAFSSTKPVVIEYGGTTLKQFPVVPGKICRLSVNFSGGGYFRLLPYPLIHHLMAQSEYVMTYFHPRDFDPEQPRVPKLPPHRIFKSYVGLRSSLKKFKQLLTDFTFVDLDTANLMIDWAAQPTIQLNSHVAPVAPSHITLQSGRR